MMSSTRNPKAIDVNISSSGDNTVIAAGDSNSPVRVWQLNLQATGGANNLIFKKNTTAFNSGAFVLLNNGNLFLADTGSCWFDVPAGQALVINLSAATAVIGQIYYTTG